jgi:putative ABC transport system substrate-binding protein
MIRRREFITLLGGTAAWPLVARAQQGRRVRRIGALLNYAATQIEGQAALAAFVQELRQLGWNEGQNLQIEVRWNAGDAELAKIFAAQLIGLMPDVVLAATSTNLTMLRQVTSTVPIVFVTVTDPLEPCAIVTAAPVTRRDRLSAPISMPPTVLRPTIGRHI